MARREFRRSLRFCAPELLLSPTRSASPVMWGPGPTPPVRGKCPKGTKGVGRWPAEPREGGLGHCDDEPPWAKELAARDQVREKKDLSLAAKSGKLRDGAPSRRAPRKIQQKRGSVRDKPLPYKRIGQSKTTARDYVPKEKKPISGGETASFSKKLFKNSSYKGVSP